jgi:hypothetical protein
MVVVTIVFGGITFCGSSSGSAKSTAYKHGGLEQVEFHQALPRLFYYYINAFYTPAALTVSPVINLMGPKSRKPNSSFTFILPTFAFTRAITINAP